MTPATTIQNAAADGVSLSLSARGTITVGGHHPMVSRWLPVIREHKAAIIEVLRVGAGDTPSITSSAETVRPFDVETFEERAAIAEFDGWLDRVAAESLAWAEDDRRRCTQCTNRREHDGVCKIAAPTKGALVIANKSYAPDPVLMRRCEGYMPKTSDNDQRPGAERWPGLIQKGND